MKKADPNCDQCKGSGLQFFNGIFGRAMKHCLCLKEEDWDDISQGYTVLKSHKIEHWLNLDTPPRKPKRKRHLLRRYKR